MDGAMIERGEIISALTEGYKVKSFTRPGLITPMIPAITADPHSVGDLVYFFLFTDGHGAIVASIV